jgi:hypothetical protein
MKKTKAERYPLGLPGRPLPHSKEGRANISAGVKKIAKEVYAKRLAKHRREVSKRARVELLLAKSKREAPAPVDLFKLKRRIQDELNK